MVNNDTIELLLEASVKYNIIDNNIVTTLMDVALKGHKKGQHLILNCLKKNLFVWKKYYVCHGRKSN